MRISICALLLGVAAGSALAGTEDLPVAPVSGIALRGTLVSSDPNFSRAIVAFSGGDERVVGIGAELPKLGVLTAVEARRIIVRRGGSLYEFRFNDSDEVAPGAQSSAQVAPLPAINVPVASESGGGTGVRDATSVNWDELSKRKQPMYRITRDPRTGRVVSAERNPPQN